jgi:chromosome segregation ATPase
MLMRVMGLVSGKDQELVESVRSSHANWWSAKLVADTLVSIEAVTKELSEIADFQLSNYLLAQVVAVARAKVQAEQAETANLKSALEAEQAGTTSLKGAIKAAETEIAILRSSLQAEQAQVRGEQAQVTNLHQILQAEQVQAAYLLGHIQQLEAKLAAFSHYHGVFGALREIGDRITGGGLRNLAKRIRA